MFLKNAWYVACKPEDIEGKPLSRQVSEGLLAHQTAAAANVSTAACVTEAAQ